MDYLLGLPTTTQFCALRVFLFTLCYLYLVWAFCFFLVYRSLEHLRTIAVTGIDDYCSVTRK